MIHLVTHYISAPTLDNHPHVGARERDKEAHWTCLIAALNEGADRSHRYPVGCADGADEGLRCALRRRLAAATPRRPGATSDPVVRRTAPSLAVCSLVFDGPLTSHTL